MNELTRSTAEIRVERAKATLERVVRRLIRAVQSGDDEARIKAAFVIRRMSADAVFELGYTLGDSRRSIDRLKLVEALAVIGEVGFGATERALKGLLFDRDARVREAAERALAGLRGSEPTSAEGRRQDDGRSVGNEGD